MRVGTLLDYQCSPDGAGIPFPLSMLSCHDSEAEACFNRQVKRLCDTLGNEEPGAVHQWSHIARADRFFVAALRPPEEAGVGGSEVGANFGQHLPLIVCPLAANRHRLTGFCEEKRLFFHSIEHAQYSTMVLLRELLLQRRLPPDALPPTEEELDEAWEQQEQHRHHATVVERTRQYEGEHMGPEPCLQLQEDEYACRQQCEGVRAHCISQQHRQHCVVLDDADARSCKELADTWGGEDELDGVGACAPSSPVSSMSRIMGGEGCDLDTTGEGSDGGGHPEHHSGLGHDCPGEEGEQGD